MALLNYSSKVPIGKTIGEMQQKLAAAGARQIMVEYDDSGHASGLSFAIETSYGRQGFTLPIQTEPIYRLLCAQMAKGELPAWRGDLTPERAAIVSWRILKDWLEAQIALIETSMVTLDQVMLPYMRAGRDGQTLYDLVRDQQLALSDGGP